MKLNFTFLLCIFIIPTVLAQKPAGIVVKTEIKPSIDGVIDETVWDKANVYSIETPFEGETPTLGSEDETNWRAMWDADGIYVFIKVTDNLMLRIQQFRIIKKLRILKFIQTRWWINCI